jgi:integrase
MGNRKTPGLTKRGRIWHLNKQFRGVRIRESAATTILTEAVELLASRIEGVRQSQLYGARPSWTFREAAQKYLKENQHKRSVSDDERHLAMLDPFIGDLLLSRVYMETLRPFIEKRNKDGVKTKTINLSLETVRRILRLAADEWRDKQGATWLQMAPKIKLFRITDARKPHSLSVEEQQFLFNQLPRHLLRIALYKANTGCRQEEVCSLRWEWEKQMPEFGRSVFVVPGEKVKNTEERLVVLNRIARSVIEETITQCKRKSPLLTITHRSMAPAGGKSKHARQVHWPIRCGGTADHPTSSLNVSVFTGIRFAVSADAPSPAPSKYWLLEVVVRLAQYEAKSLETRLFQSPRAIRSRISEVSSGWEIMQSCPACR